MTSRRESGYAGDRKHVRLVELKLVDLLRTNDALEFTYKERTFKAVVSRDGRICAERHPRHARAIEQDEAYSYYAMPSNFTNDCVAVYWNGSDACKTNPSGYERVKHVRSDKTLNELRDEYMREHVRNRRLALSATGGGSGDASSDETRARDPMAVVEAIESRAPTRSAKRRRSSAAAAAMDDADDVAAAAAAMTPDATGAAVAQALNDRMSSVATVRASGRVPGYKGIADALQSKLAGQTTVVTALMGYVERFATQHGDPDELRSQAQAIVGGFERGQQAAAAAEPAVERVELSARTVAKKKKSKSERDAKKIDVKAMMSSAL
jgi:hypothetical protein